jgi:hypothetical protein
MHGVRRGAVTLALSSVHGLTVADWPEPVLAQFAL